MIRIPYYIDKSTIPNAGKGLFAKSSVSPGKIIVAPTDISEIISLDEYNSRIHKNENFPHSETSVRWFDDVITISHNWIDDNYINHSFSPNSIWHLGFTFCIKPILSGEEVTMDYSFLIGSGIELYWRDSLTGNPIIGMDWDNSIFESTKLLFMTLQSYARCS